MFMPKFCLHLAGGAVIAGSLVVVAIPQPAQADLLYTFDTYTGSGSPPAGPYGTVDLNQDGANVDVTVTLAAGEGFTNTGAGAALTWDLAGEPVVSISNLDATKFSVSHNGTSTGNLDGTGSWFYEIDCTAAACGSGGNHPYPGPLTFTIDNISTADFISNGKTSTGYKFASDICTQIGTNGTCAGITGDVTATFDSATSIPEPATLSILGTALLGWRALRRRQPN
jgi:hypothetical protein